MLRQNLQKNTIHILAKCSILPISWPIVVGFTAKFCLLPQYSIDNQLHGQDMVLITAARGGQVGRTPSHNSLSNVTLARLRASSFSRVLGDGAVGGESVGLIFRGHIPSLEYWRALSALGTCCSTFFLLKSCCFFIHHSWGRRGLVRGIEPEHLHFRRQTVHELHDFRGSPENEFGSVWLWQLKKRGKREPFSGAVENKFIGSQLRIVRVVAFLSHDVRAAGIVWDEFVGAGLPGSQGAQSHVLKAVADGSKVYVAHNYL